MLYKLKMYGDSTEMFLTTEEITLIDRRTLAARTAAGPTACAAAAWQTDGRTWSATQTSLSTAT